MQEEECVLNIVKLDLQPNAHDFFALPDQYVWLPFKHPTPAPLLVNICQSPLNSESISGLFWDIHQNWLTSLKWLASFKHSWCIYQRRASVQPWIHPLRLKNNIQSIMKMSCNHPRTDNTADMIEDTELVDSNKDFMKSKRDVSLWPMASSQPSAVVCLILKANIFYGLYFLFFWILYNHEDCGVDMSLHSHTVQCLDLCACTQAYVHEHTHEHAPTHTHTQTNTPTHTHTYTRTHTHGEHANTHTDCITQHTLLVVQNMPTSTISTPQMLHRVRLSENQRVQK